MPAAKPHRAAGAAYWRWLRAANLLLACMLVACGGDPSRPAANKPAPTATRKPVVATATRRATRMPSHTPTAAPTVTPPPTSTSSPVALLPFIDDFKNAGSGLPEETYQNLKSYYSNSGFKIDFFEANLLQMAQYPRSFPADFSARLRLKLGTDLST